MSVLNSLNRLPGIMANLVIAIILGYTLYLVISSLLGIPEWWATMRDYFPDVTTFAIVVTFLLIAAYGAYKGGGKGSVIFTYIAGILLIIAFLFTLIFGPEGAKRNYIWFQEAANEVAEEGISFNGDATEVAPRVGQLVRYTDRMVLDLRPGERRTIILAGSINVLNYELGHCVSFAPNDKIKRIWNSGMTSADAMPTDPDEEVVATIRKLRPGELLREGETRRCPPLKK